MIVSLLGVAALFLPQGSLGKAVLSKETIRMLEASLSFMRSRSWRDLAHNKVIEKKVYIALAAGASGHI